MTKDDRKTFRDLERRRKAADKDSTNNIITLYGGKHDKQINTRHPHRGSNHSSIGSGVLWGIIFTLFIVYVVGYAYTYLARDDIAESKIVLGTVSSPIIIDGVIIRDETIYKSSVQGVTVYGVAELARVKKGDIICSIEDAEKVTEIEEQLNNVNTSIMDIQNEAQGLSIFDADVKKTNREIKNIIDTSSFKRMPNDISTVYDLAEKIQSHLDYRNKMLLNEKRESLKSYTAHKNLLTSQLSGVKQNVTASGSGIFSTYVDMLEANYTFENMDSLSKEKTRVKTEITNLAFDRDVYENSPIFKIVHSNDWYIAAYIPTELTSGFNLNSMTTIYVEQNDVFAPLEVIVYKMEKTSTEDTERFVLLKCTRFMLDYISMRGIRFKVSMGVAEGLKIPRTSIAEKTLLKIPEECIFDSAGKKVVVKRSETQNGIVDEQVSITFTEHYGDDNYVYIIQDYNNLKLGDVLMVNGKPLESRIISEIENVQGVYVTNTGAAIFKRIVVGSISASNSEYVILDPKLNSGLKVHDHIVTDVKHISERQMVY